MRSMPFPIALLALLLLAGCATSPDPAQGGFISGVNGLMSGGYNQRVAEQSVDLDRMRYQQAVAQTQANQAKAALADRERSVATLRDKVARLDRSLKNAQAKAARQRAENVALSSRDRQLMADLDSAKGRLATLQEQLQSRTATDDYDVVRKEYLDLETTIAALNNQVKGSQQ